MIDFSNLHNNPLQLGLFSLAVIFLVILVLVLIFTLIPRLRGGYVNSATGSTNVNGGKSKKSNIPAGDSAAIAAAIFLFLDEIHDSENRVITIKRASRIYSPWNSKIYGVNWLKNR